jgi:hypothetical protein
MNKLRRVLFNRLHVQVETQQSQVLRARPTRVSTPRLPSVAPQFVRDVLARMAYPELLQAPGDSVLGEGESAESATGSQAEVSAASEVGRETVIAERRLRKHVDFRQAAHAPTGALFARAAQSL